MKDLFSIKGKVALVTGGSRGIGEMIACGFLQYGARVYISSRSVEACEATTRNLSKHGECFAIPKDLSSVAACEELAEEIGKLEGRLDILVNNAGAAWGAPIDEYPENGWDKVVDLNLKTPFFLTQKCLPLLRKAGSREDPARIINIGSVNGLTIPKNRQIYAYTSSKAAITHLTKHLAKHLAGDCITVNCIAPGPFETKMMAGTLEQEKDSLLSDNPMNRLGTLEDIAGAAIFLSSRAGAYVVGGCITVDGGSSTTV